MAITDIKLTLMAFPQRWDGTGMDLRILVAPRGDPTLPLTAGAPAFAKARLTLNALLIPDLAALPAPANVTALVKLPVTPPSNAEALFDQLKARVKFDPAPPPVTPPAATTAFLKQLMPSYQAAFPLDRKSTRLNSSHVEISYAVFCLKKKKKNSPNFCLIKKKKTNHKNQN